MTFEHFLVVLIKRWKVVVICFIVVGLGAFMGSKLMTPLYQSSALVQVAIRANSNQSSYDSLLASDQLVQTETALAVSDPVLREVVSRYPGLTLQQLTSEATATSKLDTQLFEIDVLDPRPTRAAALANDIAATLIRQQARLDQQDNLQSQQQFQQDLVQTGKQIDTITNQLSALVAAGGDPVKIGTLKAQLNSLQQHHNQVQAALAQLELTEAQNSNFLRIVQYAQPALRPVRPDTRLNVAAGLLTGLLLGTLLVVLFELLDVRVRAPEALTELLHWPVLATIWQATFKDDVINPTGRDTNVESYRILRTNVGFSSIDKPLHTLVVASVAPRDGKSVVAANLAIFMARAGKNTLLIDADMRRPTQHELFNLPAHAMGLSNAILACSLPASTRTSLDPYVHTVGIPNLCVMPSGPLPPNPPELLDSKAMQYLLKALSESGAEIVIFDTPPLLGLSDGSILASKADGTLLVVDITRARKGYLRQVKTLLEQAGVHTLGCVVNKQRRRRSDMLSSYYYSAGEDSATDLPVAPDILQQSET